MNKQKFIDYLRSPEVLTEGQLEDLNKSLTDFPYFSIGRAIVAKAAKEISHVSKGDLTSTAAIYATDRKHLKKYINGELVFLASVPSVKNEIVEKEVEKKGIAESIHQSNEDLDNITIEIDDQEPFSIKGEQSSELKINESVEGIISDSTLNLDNLKAPTGDEVDQILDELQHDISQLKKSRGHFVNIQNQIEEEEAVSAALRRAAKKAQDDITKDVELKSTSETQDNKAKKEIDSDSELEISKSSAEKESVKAKPKTPKTTAKKEATEATPETPKATTKKEATKAKSEAPKTTAKKEATKTELKTSKPISEKEEIEAKPAKKIPSEKITITNFEVENPDEEDDIPEIVEQKSKKSTSLEGSKKEKDKATKIKKSASTSRGNRIKIKRSDLDKVMSDSAKRVKSKEEATKDKDSSIEKDEEKKPEVTKPIKGKKESNEKEKKEPKAIVKKQKVTQATTKAKTGKEEEEKKQSKTKPKTTDKISEFDQVIPEDAKITNTEDLSISTSDSKKKSKIKKSKKSTKEEDEIKKIESEIKKEKSTIEKEEKPVQSLTKAFLDYGKAGMSTSVSKASPSKRKRKSSGAKGSSRAIKPSSKSTGSTKKGSKDDDESGGTSHLLTKFIEESPSIKRRPNADNIADLSEESASWNSELASEYLAQIYLDQGNTKRAISIYETLSLKFPEKKSYFAGLIQAIKK